MVGSDRLGKAHLRYSFTILRTEKAPEWSVVVYFRFSEHVAGAER